MKEKNITGIVERITAKHILSHIVSLDGYRIHQKHLALI